MSQDDYARKQSARELEYERQYRDWMASMSPEERKQYEDAGVGEPCVQRHGNGSPDRDLADSALASHTPDMVSLVDGDDVAPTEADMAKARKVLRHLVADIVCDDNARLTIDCFSVALGMRVYSGDSMTQIAKRYGITRAAVSKRCVDIVEKLDLPPSRAMRSEMARDTYRNSQLERYRLQEQ